MIFPMFIFLAKFTKQLIQIIDIRFTSDNNSPLIFYGTLLSIGDNLVGTNVIHMIYLRFVIPKLGYLIGIFYN